MSLHMIRPVLNVIMSLDVSVMKLLSAGRQLFQLISALLLFIASTKLRKMKPPPPPSAPPAIEIGRRRQAPVLHCYQVVKATVPIKA